MEQVRYAYIPEAGIDSITQTEQHFVNQLRPGFYTVAVSALCPTNLSQANAFVIVTDTIRNVEIEQQYIVPHSGIPYNIYSQSSPYGIVPAFSCTPKGKVQIRIEDGTFPYTVDVFRIDGTDTIPVKSVNFDTNQHSGINPLHHEFQYYYDIDSLSVGTTFFSATMAAATTCHD